MKKIWVNKIYSFEDAERFDENYYLNMTSTERLNIMQFLRESYFKIIKFEKDLKNESRERLRRVVKIIKQKIRLNTVLLEHMQLLSMLNQDIQKTWIY
ncbi:hypothetical protein NLC93_07535 [Candidatus Aminicenantes bacterium AC-335-G13]|nr:hypothetical protein [Candidatus Aminicenantes bacterium AC-335-G13]